ncbi:hypothetical protein HK405_001310, partial [Cladochytrium tenue]
PRIEFFSPHYLTQTAVAPPTVSAVSGELGSSSAVAASVTWHYNSTYNISALWNSTSSSPVAVEVSLVRTGLRTHSLGFGQRLVWLETDGVYPDVADASGAGTTFRVKSPPSPEIAPPGWYLLFVVTDGVPSVGVWVSVDSA